MLKTETAFSEMPLHAAIAKVINVFVSYAVSPDWFRQDRKDLTVDIDHDSRQTESRHPLDLDESRFTVRLCEDALAERIRDWRTWLNELWEADVVILVLSRSQEPVFRPRPRMEPDSLRLLRGAAQEAAFQWYGVRLSNCLATQCSPDGNVLGSPNQAPGLLDHISITLAAISRGPASDPVEAVYEARSAFLALARETAFLSDDTVRERVERRLLVLNLVFAYIERCGISVRVRSDLGRLKGCATSTVAGVRIHISSRLDPDTQAFVALHELAHILLGHTPTTMLFTSASPDAVAQTRKQEEKADAFARLWFNAATAVQCLLAGDPFVVAGADSVVAIGATGYSAYALAMSAEFAVVQERVVS